MATYFHGNSDVQGGGDGLQTLILMNPGYVRYSDDQTPSPPVMFINSNSTGNGVDLLHASPSSQTQYFIGVPVQGGTPTTSSPDPEQQELSALPGFFPRFQSNLYNQQIEMVVACDVRSGGHQGLSLSLSSQQPPGLSAGSQRREDVGGSPSSASVVSSCVNGVIRSSKYLKATQELLDEVVNVGKIGESSSAAAGGDGFTAEEESGKRDMELTAAERQETQMKKAKLVNLLEKVEQRYRDYHHQMQIIISWFEQAAGIGSAKTYTAPALQTISKQFRRLKDSILRQISNLKYSDNQILQQRAFQQLGIIQHNVWRPQRGLPERSVSVLRAWLFEHFLHPYPKDSDKIMLAKQAGLTRNQVSNWFINARVRLWKPMVE